MNRTSKTRSASSGTPYLKPKLMSWIASLLGIGRVAEPGEDPLAQLPQRQVGRVDDDVGLAADGIEHPPLLDDRARRCRAGQPAGGGGASPRSGG